MTEAPAASPAPEATDALTQNQKALVISLLVIGGLVALMTVPVIGGAVYTLTTGKVMGSELSRAMIEAGVGKNAQVREQFEQQLASQAEVQRRYAPYQLLTEGLYLALWVALGFFAIALLRGRPARRALGQVAIFTAVARLGVAVVTWALTAEITRGTASTFMTGMQAGAGRGGQRGLSPEQADRVQTGVKAAISGLTALSTVCMALLICGYLAAVAYVFLTPRKTAP
ncbi:MAG: hypothetical protein IPJ65_41045 [Archangiaceae bacterium]|nr:hypothetical protein [Archangiaceae bacterium]